MWLAILRLLSRLDRLWHKKYPKNGVYLKYLGHKTDTIAKHGKYKF